MKKKLRVDAAGRVVLPKPVRRHFHLDPGATLDLEIARDAIILRPQTIEETLKEENGLLVYEGEPRGDLLSIVDSIRQRRDLDVTGPLRPTRR